jgi:type I restriction enzyme R subunit
VPRTKGQSLLVPALNKGYNDGAGNPPNAHGLKADYLWKELLTSAGLTNILENYAQIVEEKDPKTGKKKRRQVWPRYHQLDVVRKALAQANGRGQITGHYTVQGGPIPNLCAAEGLAGALTLSQN